MNTSLPTRTLLRRRVMTFALWISVIPALVGAPSPAEWKALDALIAAGDTPAALLRLDELARAHPDTPALATLRDRLP